MFGTVDMDSINNLNDLPRNPEWDHAGAGKDLRAGNGHSPRLDPDDLVARAKASIMATSPGVMAQNTSIPEHAGPAVDMRVGLEVEPESQDLGHADLQREAQFGAATQSLSDSTNVGHFSEELEAEAEIKVRVKTGDLLYTRADLMVRRENHLSAVVDGVLLDLGMINTDLMNAMALAHQVHVSAGHYLGGMIERRVPLVHQ